MDIIKGIYENIFSHKNTEIPFSDLDFALFKGHSGSGKSSIFDIMCWVLFGETARKKYKSILRDIPDKPKTGKGTVDVVMDDGKKYTVTRKVGRGKGLWIYEDGAEKPISFRTSTQTQQFIEKLLGMNFKTFLNIAYFSQGDVGKFLTSESSERIKVISDLLDFEQVDDMISKNKKDVENISNKIENFKGQLVVLRGKIDGIDVKRMQREKNMKIAASDKTVEDLVVVSQYLDGIKIKNEITDDIQNLKKSHNNQLTNAKHSLAQIKSTIDSLKNKKDMTPELKEKIKVCQEKLIGYDDVRKNLNKLRDEVSEGYGELAKHENKLETLKENKKTYEDILKMEGCECPTCRNIVTKKNLQHIKQKIDEISKQIDKAVIRYNEKNEQLKNKINAREIADKNMEALNRVKAYETDLKNKLKQEENRHERISESVIQYNQFKDSSKKQLDEIKKNIVRLNHDLSYYKDYKLTDLKEYQEKYNKLESLRISIEKDVALLKFQIQDYYDSVKRLKQVEDGMKVYEDEYKIIMYWKDALPKIKIEMIDSIIPFVESETNKYLSQILSGKMIKFMVDPDKATNKLDLFIYDYENGIERIFEGWSGGEKDKMTLSVYLALNKLASLRSGKRVNFLILDEKFSTLGDESKNIFDMLRNEYGDRKIWMISHVKEIDSEFKEIVNVKKINNISNVQISYN